MARYKLTLEYDGANFVGWQRQDNGLSIQAVLEGAAKAFCGEDVTAYAAGRTDAGVHALAMTAHIEIEKATQADEVCNAINQHMRPHPIAILAAEAVDDDFHARFSCLGRSYEYRIVNRRAPLALEAGRVWRVPQELDADAMHEAAQCLVGKHDFTTFRSIKCQAATPVKTLHEISVSRIGEEVVLRCAARSFLHNQVRSFVGTLVEAGKGKWRARDVEAALAAADRTRCGPVAPPDGLYFVKAQY